MEAGVHFGHQTRRWNPKMRPYIYGERNGIYIIDLEQTSRALDKACDFLRKAASERKNVVFAGILEGCASRDIEVVYNLGADEIDASKFSGAFVVYQGHHGDIGARYADVIFPGAAYTEENAIFVNTEGRAQMARRAHFPLGEARENWAIIRALSDRVGKTLPYDDLFALRQAMIAAAPSLGRIDQRPAETLDLSKIGKAGAVGSAPFRSPVADYYFTNAVARASKTMAECSAMMS
ncbi:MAG: 30S ribosomal protein S2, partial [Cyanobacteria bacterium HKST-UBA02]|nr:30S ribosomal protein S2 [Cyanobacteria bacterium HKST-UBA02]